MLNSYASTTGLDQSVCTHRGYMWWYCCFCKHAHTCFNTAACSSAFVTRHSTQAVKPFWIWSVAEPCVVAFYMVRNASLKASCVQTAVIPEILWYSLLLSHGFTVLHTSFKFFPLQPERSKSNDFNAEEKYLFRSSGSILGQEFSD